MYCLYSLLDFTFCTLSTSDLSWIILEDQIVGLLVGNTYKPDNHIRVISFMGVVIHTFTETISQEVPRDFNNPTI